MLLRRPPESPATIQGRPMVSPWASSSTAPHLETRLCGGPSLRPGSTSPPVKPKVQTSAPLSRRRRRARPRPVCALGSGWAAGPRRARLAGVKCRLRSRKAAGEGWRAAHPPVASLRSSARNVGRVPPVRYVWINIVSLGRHAGLC